ncbi:putative Multidrug resistance protein ABC transporter family protein [Melia azedarach]|uniref:Multidrug resistance protein ABC transporter family protein n=1 Tax=Melia azedarach TaxID=155640 RepID=A0ACC1YX55_MELAZ|nr:putative Multidrug resistance protein ABC transporter family protein [Melia azedarach]
MGNYITYRPSDATGKVILRDGTVHEFDKPLTVAELMLEHPQQVVVELCSAVSEKRPNPLPADKKLEVKKVYVMIPMKRGKPASLSSDEARQVLLSANSLLRSRSLISSSKFLPLFAKICPAVTGEEHRFIQLQKNKENVEEGRSVEFKFESEFLPECLDGGPEYLSRQLSGKGWKPSLDTIKEKKVEKKVSHWLYQKGFIVSN